MTTINYTEALGQISVNFSDLEAGLAGIAWDLIGDKKVGQIVTAQLSFHQLLDKVSSLFRHRYEDKSLIDELEGLLVQAKLICDERNKYVHSVWFNAPDTLHRVRLRAKRKEGLTFQSEDMNPEELSQFAHKIFSFIFILDEFRVKIFEGSEDPPYLMPSSS